MSDNNYKAENEVLKEQIKSLENQLVKAQMAVAILRSNFKKWRGYFENMGVVLNNVVDFMNKDT